VSARGAWLAGCVALGACGRLGFPALIADGNGDGSGSGSDARRADGSNGIDAALQPTCASGATPVLFDGFTGTGASCSAGGLLTKSGGMTAVQGSGLLTLTPASGNTGDAECTWDPFPFGTGALFHVPAVMTQSNLDDTIVSVVGKTAGSVAQLQVNVGAPTLQFDDNVSAPVGSIAWNSAKTTWWRFTAADATHIIGAYSSNGATWTDLGTITLTGDTSASVKVTLGASYGGPTAPSDVAQFGAIFTCP
jgi:hypothetical protein